MKIGIIGSGNIGATTARLFVNAGHQVAISNSRGAQSLTSLVASIGADAKATTVQALAFGDVILCNTMEEERRVTIITIRIA
jgi:predicted dinucleotide-binding enzyme